MKKVSGFAKGAAKEATKTVLKTVVNEIVEETNAKEIAKEKVMEAGKAILQDKSVPNADKVKKEVLKRLIKKQLGI